MGRRSDMVTIKRIRNTEHDGGEQEKKRDKPSTNRHPLSGLHMSPRGTCKGSRARVKFSGDTAIRSASDTHFQTAPRALHPRRKASHKKSVLVLCQRKEGVGTDYRVLVHEKLIPTLEALIKTFLRKMMGNDDTTIEYMAPLNTFSAHSEQFDKVDFDMSLKTKDPSTEQFCKEHLEFYDLIVMQTCPWVDMDLQLVGSILKKGGYVLCTAVQHDGMIDNMDELMVNGKYDLPVMFKKFGFIRVKVLDLLTFKSRRM
jgi:hypothetical protein